MDEEGPITVLILEHHRDTRVVLAAHLARLGYRVVTVATVHDARDAINTQRFDVFLSDLDLPDAHASTLQDVIREHHAMYSVAITGHGMPTDVTLAIGAGFRAHITKPMIMERLASCLAAAAGERAMASAEAGHLAESSAAT